MNSKIRILSERLVSLGVISSLLAAIWSPEEFIKWVLTAIYLVLVGKFFGLSYRKERVIGSYIARPFKKLNFLNMRKK
jgi:hypothetical protein